MKEVDKRTTKWQQRWEGPFHIAKYNNETKGYSLECIDGKVLEAEVPIVRLKVIQEKRIYLISMNLRKFWMIKAKMARRSTLSNGNIMMRHLSNLQVIF